MTKSWPLRLVVCPHPDKETTIVGFCPDQVGLGLFEASQPDSIVHAFHLACKAKKLALTNRELLVEQASAEERREISCRIRRLSFDTPPV